MAEAQVEPGEQPGDDDDDDDSDPDADRIVRLDQLSKRVGRVEKTQAEHTSMLQRLLGGGGGPGGGSAAAAGPRPGTQAAELADRKSEIAEAVAALHRQEQADAALAAMQQNIDKLKEDVVAAQKPPFEPLLRHKVMKWV